ncbi:MAG: carboxypeptidase regulatory-like domain-containing protein, partial [Candidatus Acidiferrales bacterium]
MKRPRILIAGLATLLLVAGACVAADTPITLHGRVVDEDGLPVGGAQVKLEMTGGESFIGTTDDAGAFTIENLAAGEYTAHIAKPGFFVLEGQKFELAADSGEISFTLNHAEELREKVEVTAPANQVETSETPQKITLTTQEIRDIPVPSSHDLAKSLILLPQVLLDRQGVAHVAGSRATQVQYLLNGIEIGEPVNNALVARFSVDAVRSAEVQTGRLGAEFAHPGAAVLSFDTPDGDDHWRFKATDFIPGINVQQGLQLGNYYPRVEFSGPIVSGKLWFSQAFSVQHSLSVMKGLAPGEPDTSTVWAGDSLSRLLWHSSSRHSLVLSFLYNDADDFNQGLDALHPVSTTLTQHGHQAFGSVKDQYWFHDTLVEFGFAGHDSHDDYQPQGNAPYKLLVDGTSGDFFQSQNQEGRRYQGFFDATRAGLKWHGKHTVSGGANVSSVRLEQASMRGEIQALYSDNTTLSRLTTFTGPAEFRVGNTLAGAFVQDTWTINAHFIATAGVRTDWDRLVHSAMAEPRAALNWMPFTEKTAKFSIGWGMYDIPLNLSVIGQTADQQQVDTLYDATGAVTAGPVTSRFVLQPGALRQPYFDITSAGWQQRFGEKTIVSVELLARNQHRGLAFETATPGQIGSEFLLQATRRDKYRGATVLARHSFSGGAEVFGSYTRSRASSDQVLDPALGALNFAAQQSGPLAWDAPNRFLGWASVPTPLWGILFSCLVDYRTGYPFSVVNQQQFLVGAANSRRFPDYASLNISLEKKFRFRGYLFAVRGSAINVLGRENPDVVVNNNGAPNFLALTGGQG